jgi:hypothetical protein
VGEAAEAEKMSPLEQRVGALDAATLPAAANQVNGWVPSGAGAGDADSTHSSDSD